MDEKEDKKKKNLRPLSGPFSIGKGILGDFFRANRDALASNRFLFVKYTYRYMI